MEVSKFPALDLESWPGTEFWFKEFWIIAQRKSVKCYEMKNLLDVFYVLTKQDLKRFSCNPKNRFFRSSSFFKQHSKSLFEKNAISAVLSRERKYLSAFPILFKICLFDIDMMECLMKTFQIDLHCRPNKSKHVKKNNYTKQKKFQFSKKYLQIANLTARLYPKGFSFVDCNEFVHGATK
jgi:hypothetical protein